MRPELLAAITDLAPPETRAIPAQGPSSPVVGDMVLILGLGLALTLILALLVYVWHRWRRSSGRGGGNSSGSRLEGGERSGRFNRRRRRRRNPTLAETGGLPPARDPASSPPAA